MKKNNAKLRKKRELDAIRAGCNCSYQGELGAFYTKVDKNGEFITNGIGMILKY